MADPHESDIQRTLGRLEEALNGLAREVRDSNSSIRVSVSSHDQRITNLERWRVYLVAFSAGAAVTTSVLSTLVWRIIGLMK